MVEYGSLSRDCDVLWLAKPSNPSISEKAARLAACMWLRQTSMLIEPHIFSKIDLTNLQRIKYANEPCASSPGQVGACDFLVENECCIN